ncbi:MAG: hypothetical protein ACTHOU_06685 [Aureliella sp.]
MSTTWKIPQAPPPLPSPVASRRRLQRGTPPAPQFRRGWRQYQSSGVSLVVHCALFLFLAMLGTGSVGTTGQGVEQPILVAMVAGEESSQGIFVEAVGATALGNDASAGGGESAAAGGDSALPGADSAPIDVGSVLAGIEPGGGSGVGDVGDAAGGLGLGDGGPALGGSSAVPKVKTSVFGIEGTGTRFVYVFDRSSSMNGYSGLPMANAKRELIKSLQSLGRAHQFQLIFYNEVPMAYGQLAGTMKMLNGTDDNKQRAIGYVRGMKPDGGTEHLAALRMGLAMGPDVIFFLTDADQPALSARNLDDLVDRAERIGAVIHTIQFGAGSNQGTGAWIAELAHGTGGKYRYVDVTTFSPASFK